MTNSPVRRTGISEGMMLTRDRRRTDEQAEVMQGHARWR
jgi:hypothetical protein